MMPASQRRSGIALYTLLQGLLDEDLLSATANVVVDGIAYVIMEKEMRYFPSLMQKSVVDILLFIAAVAFKIFFFVCLVLIVLAALDYVYQRWQHEK